MNNKWTRLIVSFAVGYVLGSFGLIFTETPVKVVYYALVGIYIVVYLPGHLTTVFGVDDETETRN